MRLLTIGLSTLLLVLALSACGGGADAPADQSTATPDPAATTTAEPTSASTQTPTNTATTTPTPEPTAVPLTATATPNPDSSSFDATTIYIEVERVSMPEGSESGEKQIVSWPDHTDAIVVRAETSWRVEREDGCLVQVRDVNVIEKARAYDAFGNLKTEYYDWHEDFVAYELPSVEDARLFAEALRAEAKSPDTVVGTWPSELLQAIGYYEGELPPCGPDGKLMVNDMQDSQIGVRQVRVMEGPLRVRRDPNSSFEEIAVLQARDLVKLINADNPDWFFIELDDGQRGWISRAFSQEVE